MQDSRASDDRVLRFRPRRSGELAARHPERFGPETPVADLSRYERSAGADDYSHRMTANLAGAAFALLLAAAGIWLAGALAEQRVRQDCVLMGRRDCAPIIRARTRDLFRPSSPAPAASLSSG